MEVFMLWLREHDGNVSPAAVARRRAYLNRLEKEVASGAVVHRMEDIPWLLEGAVSGRRHMIETCAWPYADQVGLITEVGTSARNLDQLLDLASVTGDDTRRRRQRVEALMTVDIALAMHSMEPRRQRAERSLNAFVDELDERRFDGYDHVTLWSVHDPKDHLVIKTGVGSPPSSLPAGLLLTRPAMRRLMRVGHERIPILFNPRNKDRFMTVMKLLRQYRDDKRPGARLEIHDMCGLSLVVPEVSHVEPVLAALEEHLVAAGATVLDPPSPYDNPTVVTGNPHTGKGFRVAKQTVFIGDQPFELQVQAQEDYLNTLYGLTQVNHDSYRVEQALGHYLPVLFPQGVYDVAWESKDVGDRIRSWKRRRLSADLASVAAKLDPASAPAAA